MHPAIAELTTILAPPPSGGDRVDRESVRERFGWTFPADYRDFRGIYVMGGIEDSLGILAPPFPGYPYGTHMLEHAQYPSPTGELCRG